MKLMNELEYKTYTQEEVETGLIMLFGAPKDKNFVEP